MPEPTRSGPARPLPSSCAIQTRARRAWARTNIGVTPAQPAVLTETAEQAEYPAVRSDLRFEIATERMRRNRWQRVRAEKSSAPQNGCTDPPACRRANAPGCWRAMSLGWYARDCAEGAP